MAEKIPGSLVGATLTQVRMEKRHLRFVPIDGVAPSLESFQSGTYPFGKTLYVVLGAKKSPASERFLAFLRSPKGVAALRETGVLLSSRMRLIAHNSELTAEPSSPASACSWRL